ncbi:MAG TPA: hypothetical protein VFX92_09770 [Candidatus Krumholzibacteria bacterium]|nr:hypothetical protein [Candidatus Krumholzibacteria bacterium]
MTRQLDRGTGLCYKGRMQFVTPRQRRARVRAALVAPLVTLAIALALSCSSDPETPLGSDSDILGSTPGDVFQDTIAVYGDTVFAYNSLIAADSSLGFGRALGYERAMIINFSFSGAALDVNKVVDHAELRLVARDINGSFPARIYRLRDTYAEATDSVPSLDTLSVVVDPTTGSAERALQLFPATYPVPADLVQGWVRGDTTRTAIAIVYTDPVNDRLASFKSRESAKDRPQLQVFYTDNTRRTFNANSDGTFIRPTSPPSGNLVVADGYVRRTYFRVRLDELALESAVHTARVRLHIVPGSVNVSSLTAVVYVPASSNPASKDFLSGQLVTNALIVNDDATVDFKLTNSIFLTLRGLLDDNGFVIRMDEENTELRQIEFYGTSAAIDSLRPRVFITSSTPADFNP